MRSPRAQHRRRAQPASCPRNALRVGLSLLGLGLGAAPAAADAPAVTVYNQDFGVVREKFQLDLKAGLNSVRFTETTAHVEPASVILRDPSGMRRLQILEQNYRNDPLSQELLLNLYEGQTIEFLANEKIVIGRIVRSGYVSHTAAWNRYGEQYAYRQMAMTNTGGNLPIIEVDGKLRFGLPGLPLFPSLKDDTILKPTLEWQLETDVAGPLNAELCYVTGGMSWSADYNVIAPVEGDSLDLIGWVTIDNQSGRTFENARIKLVAGDVNKLQPQDERARERSMRLAMSGAGGGMRPPVDEKAFDEYHLYTLANPSTLRDRQTKQVEFLRAGGLISTRLYVYEGGRIDPQRFSGWDPYTLRTHPEYVADVNRKVWVMREIQNTQANHLGMPLPAGRLRFYRSDTDGQLEFVGEDQIDHTPRDEKVRLYTGNAFDLVGERRRTDFKTDGNARWTDETFEIRLRNRKKEPAEIRVVERLYRWHNWTLTAKSREFEKIDSNTIEFVVSLKPDEEAVITYTVHYTW